MVSTDLFQAFRWAENGASWEWRENNKRAGIEKESDMSIAQWRPYFHCQGIRPTQLVDPQLIMYFFFILRLLSNFFGNLRITVAWITKNVTFWHRKRYDFTIYTPIGYKKHNHRCSRGPPGYCCRLFPGGVGQTTLRAQFNGLFLLRHLPLIYPFKNACIF